MQILYSFLTLAMKGYYDPYMWPHNYLTALLAVIPVLILVQRHFSSFDHPLLIFEAEKDLHVKPHGTRLLYERAVGPKKWVLCKDCYHAIYYETPDRIHVGRSPTFASMYSSVIGLLRGDYRLCRHCIPEQDDAIPFTISNVATLA